MGMDREGGQFDADQMSMSGTSIASSSAFSQSDRSSQSGIS